jgi:hypothetical protein
VSPRKELIEELIDILNTTKSRDTFLATLTLLQPMKKRAQVAVPAILRNAERLGIFNNHTAAFLQDEEEAAKNPDVKLGQKVMEILTEIMTGEAPRPSAPAVAGSLSGAGVGALVGNLVGKSVEKEPPTTRALPEAR